MAEAHANFLQHIRHLIGTIPEAALTDSQLLERFATNRDETAMEVLVRRYGPLVFGVCRRVLRNSHSAEDVFQATFLILMRKASSLEKCNHLGSWLYTVAYRLALRARATEARRRQCEAQAAQCHAEAMGQPTSPGDLEVALEEELQRLPERYRAPLVLCYLQGKTNEEAAQLLGYPRGSMSARLAQARERLRLCMGQRGYAVPTAAIVATLGSAAAEGAVPPSLIANTVRAALWFAGTEVSPASFVSAQAVALARGAVRTMFLNKLKIAAELLLATAMVGTGATLLLRAASHAESPEAAERPNIGPGPVEIPGDPLPKGVVARMGTTQLRHGDAIFFAAYLPGGDAVVTAGKDQTVRLWNLASGKEVRRFDWGRIETTSAPEPLTDMLRQKIDQQNLDDIALSSQVAVSSDGRTVAASRGGTVCLWEIANGKPIRQLQTGQSRLAYLAFSADGKSLLTAGPSGKVAAIWEVATGQCVRRSEAPLRPGYDNGVMPIVEQSVVASPSLRYLAYQWRHATGSKWIHIRDLATGSELPAIELGGYGGPLPCCFSADDKTLVWVDWFFGGGIVFSEVATGKEQRRLGDLRRKYDASVDNTEPTLAIALSADGKYVASCRHSHTIELWDLASGRSMYPVGRPTKLQLLERFTNSVGAQVRPALAFSPDSKRLVCSLGGAAIRQFRSDTGEEIPGPGSEHHAAVSTLALSTDCKSLWTFGSGESARRWDWATGGEAKRLDVPAGATHVAFARDGRFAYAVGNYVTVATDAGKKSWKVAGDWPPLEALALSPDGKLLATRNYETPEVNVWDATGKKRYTLEGGSDSPLPGGTGAGETAGVVTPELVFSPDGQRLAGAGPRRQLCVWDVANGSLLWEVLPQIGQAIERLAFSPNGSCLAVVHTDRTISLYESSTGGRRGRFGEADARHSKSYMAEDYYGRFRLARTTRAAPVCLTFSPNSRFLALAKDTPAIHLWDVLTSREVCQLKGHEGGVASLLFAPDGRHLFSGGIDTTALSWDLTGKMGSSIGRESPVGRGLTDPASLWADLASQDAERAFDALRQLSASPAEAVTLIGQHLLPLASVGEKRLDRLLVDLGSEHLGARYQAESVLVQLGKRARPALEKALSEEQPLLVRQRLQSVLDKIHTPTTQQMQDSRAVELLELIGSPEAQQLLQTLALGDPTAPLTRQSNSALQRLSK